MAPITDSSPLLQPDLSQLYSRSEQISSNQEVSEPLAREAASNAHDLQPHHALLARQSQQTQPIIVPATYIGSNPGANGGEVAGIVLGVTFGVVLVLWILSSLRTNPLRPVVGTSSVTDVSRYRGGEKNSKTERTRSSGRKTNRSRSKSAVSREEVSESQQIRRERGGGSGRSPRRARETVIVEESRRESRPPPPEEDYGDDIVEVIEEESDISPVRRQRRTPGYRNVDPSEYGGGPRSIRSVRR